MTTRSPILPLLWLALLTAPLTLQGQQDGNRQPARAKGKLKAAAAGMLQVVGEDGDQWLVKLDPRVRGDIALQGSADAAFLRPGMIVEFQAAFDKRGKAQAPIRQLKIFTPRQDSRLGLIPAGAGLGGAKLFQDEPDPQKQPKKPRAETVTYLVAGTLRGIKDGKIQVAAGRAVVQAELADKVQISVDLADLRLARAGDTVDVSGWSYPGQGQVIIANRIIITAAKPLGLVEAAEKGKNKKPDLNSLDF